ncbi:MAG: hypothetical protein AB8B61_09765 [Cyclobacteriaceae bacterium]
MSLNKLLRLQIWYCLIGIVFNLISWIFIKNDYQPLTPTVPMVGIFVMLTYSIFLLAGYFRKIYLYRALMFLSILIFAYGGVLKHVYSLYQYPELYNTIYSGLVAIAINAFGLALNMMATLGKFKLS